MARIGESDWPRAGVLANVPSPLRHAELRGALERYVFPRLLEKKRPLRIWVTGPTTGEEAYGLAIALHEYAAERRETPPPFKIFGTDLCERAIEQARTGRFLGTLAHDVSPELLQSYFVKDGETFRVRSDIRSACVFATHDVARDPLLSHMDLVSCWHVLGGLTEKRANRLLAGFHHALGERSFLLLGRGEDGFESSGFRAIDAPNGIFERSSSRQAAFGFGLPGVVDTARERVSRTPESRADTSNLQMGSRHADTIIENINQGVVVLGPGLRIKSANRAFLSQFALDSRDIEDCPLAELGVGVLGRPGLLHALRSLGPGEGFSGHKLRLEPSSPEGEPRSFIAGARRMDHAGFTLLTLEDVTAAEEARAAVKRAEHDFRRILHEADEAIILTDSAGQPFFANRAAAELFGYAAEEMFGCSLRQLLPGLDIERDEATLARAASGEVHRSVAGRRKDGREFPARVIVTSTARDRRPVTVVFVTDISREREAERARRDFQEQLERMAFDAALTEERERRRIALGLHDRLGQTLAVAQLKLASAREDVPGELKSAVKDAIGLVEQAVAEVRTLMFDLSPPVLYELGLRDAISWLVEDSKSATGCAWTCSTRAYRNAWTTSAAASCFARSASS